MSDVSEVGEIIAHMKRHLGVELDRELASALEIDATAVSAWRRRGKVPEKYLLRMRRRGDEAASFQTNRSAHLPLMLGSLREAYIFSLISYVSRRLPNQISFDANEEFENIWAGFRLVKLFEYLDKELPHTLTKDELRAEFEHQRRILERANLPVWLENLQ